MSGSRAERAIVFGGSGFLGSHVADALTRSGYQVRVFDRARSSYLTRDQEMIVGDIMDQKAVIEAAKGCAYVYNFAGLADINDAKTRPVDTAAVNVLGNVHTLEAARLTGAKRFLFASTVYVYSESGSFYRASKQASERFVETYQSQYGLDYTVLRYGSLYGRRADERNGIYRLVKQALESKAIQYEGSGETMREYIHVEDAASLSVKVLSEEYKNRHIIVTGHERMKVASLMRMIAEMVPGGAEVTFGKDTLEAHYVLSPYSFNPRLGHKLIATDHVDLGQGLLDCMAEIHEKLHRSSQHDGDVLLAPDGV